jgi:hypothetical protein
VASNFPTSLDNFTNPSSGNTLDSPSHSLQHSDINDAVEAMQRKVGVGTAVAGSASAGQVLTISAAGTSTWSTPTTPGLVQIVPSSISVGSGSGSVDANGAVTFSAASSVTVNGVFSSTFDNYLLVGGGGVSSTRNSGLLTLGATATGYYYHAVYGRYNATTVVGENGSNRTSWTNVYQGSTNSSQMYCNLYGPNLAKNTMFDCVAESIGTGEYHWRSGGYLANDTQYTSFTLTADSGTFGGTIRVYGYRN